MRNMNNNKAPTLLVLMICAIFRSALSFVDGEIPNGNFEQGPKPSQMKGALVTDPHAIPNWETSGIVEYIKPGQKQGDMLLIVPEGSSAVRLGDDARITTKVRVRKGMFHSISFKAVRTCAQEEKLNVSVTPNSEGKDWGILPTQTAYSCDGWDTYSWGFLAEADEVEIEFHNPSSSKDTKCGPIIDCVALKACTPPKRQRGNLLKNGDFEEGPYISRNTSWGILIPPNIEDDHSPLIGWVIESLKAVNYIDSDHFKVPAGRRAVELIGGRESALAQTVRTVPGKTYDMAFLIGDGSNSCQGSMVVEVAAGRQVFRVVYESKGIGGFESAKIRFKAVSARTRVRFLSEYYHVRSRDGSLCGPVIDDVRLWSVRNVK